MKFFYILIAFTVSTASAFAQWAVVNLHPEGSRFSEARGVSGGRVFGHAYFGDHYDAGIWSNDASSWVALTPNSAFGAFAYGMYGNSQVGQVYGGSISIAHASLWHGTSESWVDLHPDGSDESYAWGISENQQVGAAIYAQPYYKAVLWRGTKESLVNLHPAGAFESFAFAGWDNYQAGYFRVGTGWENEHACLWTGTAESIVDLNPTGSTVSSIYGAYEDQQVGRSSLGAGLWHGTAESYVNLSPAGFARAVYKDNQVGNVSVVGIAHASYWNGTPESWVDLHSFLPDEFSRSDAQSVWSDSTHIYVVGSGFNTVTNRDEAIMWVRPVPEPTTIAVLGIGLLAAIKKRRRSPDSRSIK